MVLADVPGPQETERGYKKRNDGTKNKNEGTFAKTGMRAHSPKLPFYKTAFVCLDFIPAKIGAVSCCFEHHFLFQN